MIPTKICCRCKPIAVLTADIHYNLQTLPLADAAMRQAIDKANSLNVPLIVAGDLHDTKANLRGECVNAMLATFNLCETDCYILRGNHDAIHEKSEDHSLRFLTGNYRHIVTAYSYYDFSNGRIRLLPYYYNVTQIAAIIKNIPQGSIVIMHQGLQSSNMGDYIQDKSAITKEDVAGLRVISGHYHARQTFEIPDGGKWDYIGNPFTLSWGEAKDPEKGFQILYDDGSLEFVPTNLRKHVIIEADLQTNTEKWSSTPAHTGGGRNDLIWVKAKGTKEQVSKFNKVNWLRDKGISQNVRLDLIPIDTETTAPRQQLSQTALLDSMIESLTNTSQECKNILKQTWKSMCE